MIGILLALQVNTWNELRIAKKTELVNMQELVNNLKQDIQDLRHNLKADASILNSFDVLLDHIKQSDKFHDSLAYHFGMANRYTNFINSTSAYESLKSIGLNSIKDSELRFQIIAYYERTSKVLLNVEGEFINTVENNFMKPLKIKYLDYDTKFGPAVPKDFEALLTEGNLKTVLVELKNDFEWKIGLTEDCHEKAQKLLTRINSKLKK